MWYLKYNRGLVISTHNYYTNVYVKLMCGHPHIVWPLYALQTKQIQYKLYLLIFPLENYFPCICFLISHRHNLLLLLKESWVMYNTKATASSILSLPLLLIWLLLLRFSWFISKSSQPWFSSHPDNQVHPYRNLTWKQVTCTRRHLHYHTWSQR